MPSIHRLVPLLVALYTLTACTTAPAQRMRHVDTAPPIAPSAHVYVTGSRIPIPSDDYAATLVPNSARLVVSRRDISLTGQSSLGAALRQLVPALN
jgi:hypothetical protein